MFLRTTIFAASIRDAFEISGLYNKIPKKNHLFPTIHDAILQAQQSLTITTCTTNSNIIHMRYHMQCFTYTVKHLSVDSNYSDYS